MAMPVTPPEPPVPLPPLPPLPPTAPVPPEAPLLPPVPTMPPLPALPPPAPAAAPAPPPVAPEPPTPLPPAPAPPLPSLFELPQPQASSATQPMQKVRMAAWDARVGGRIHDHDRYFHSTRSALRAPVRAALSRGRPQDQSRSPAAARRALRWSIAVSRWCRRQWSTVSCRASVVPARIRQNSPCPP